MRRERCKGRAKGRGREALKLLENVHGGVLGGDESNQSSAEEPGDAR